MVLCGNDSFLSAPLAIDETSLVAGRDEKGVDRVVMTKESDTMVIEKLAILLFDFALIFLTMKWLVKLF